MIRAKLPSVRFGTALPWLVEAAVEQAESAAPSSSEIAAEAAEIAAVEIAWAAQVPVALRNAVAVMAAKAWLSVAAVLLFLPTDQKCSCPAA